MKPQATNSMQMCKSWNFILNKQVFEILSSSSDLRLQLVACTWCERLEVLKGEQRWEETKCKMLQYLQKYVWKKSVFINSLESLYAIIFYY